MRFKRLHLHGYKTFANKTEFIFDNGVTAIVGPNGSGKSNVADAVRWVLGEQAYGVLRGKKSEDMIFSGSSQRARMGMAEAVITLDNSDNWLPIEFDEVVIGRRAYRSGENEYHLNGNKVRLRDVLELLDRSGLGRRSSMVIGQGMVDQALSLRPEDRRLLFEEAAGITAYQKKRDQALEKLQQTEDNLTRVRDIVAEISPRLRQLERQAERTRQYEEISGELRQRLSVWHGYNWHQALGRLVDARNAVEHWVSVIARTSKEIEQFNASAVVLRQRQTDLRGQLAGWRRQHSEQESERSVLGRDLAVAQERLRALHADDGRLHDELELLRQRLAGERERHTEAAAVLAAANEQRRAQETQLAQAQAELSALETTRRQTETELAGLRRKHLDFSSRLTDRQNRLEQAKERRLALQSERQTEIQAAETAAAEATGHEQDYEAARLALQELGERIGHLRERHRQTDVRRQEHLTRRAALDSQRAELETQVRTLRARHELLDRLRAEGEGLFAGVRQVMQASQRGQLAGVLGPVATLLTVPDRFELAIEIALGARLQDVVVRTWDDADRAISYLKQQRGGRATFLPLDNLRPQSRRQAPKDPGVLGWAADLVQFDASVSPAVELLLGQIVVAQDLAAARRVSQGGDRPRIVTLDGDFVHPGGSVSGGSREENQRGGMLAREREWRSLPAQIETISGQLKACQQDIETQNQAIKAVEEELTGLVREASALGAEERERTGALGRVQNAIDRARQTEVWHRNRAQKQAVDLENFGRQLAGLRQEIDDFSVQQVAASNRIEALEAKLATLASDGLLQAVAQARARLDAAEESRRSQQSLADSFLSTVRRTESEISAREQRQATVAGEREMQTVRLSELQDREAVVQQAFRALDAKIQPAQAELDKLESGWAEHDRQGARLRDRLHQEELQINQARLGLQRADDHLTYLRSEIEHDFGLVALETGVGYVSQDPLPFDQMVTALPRVESIPLELEMEIQRMKGLLSRLGAINPDAPAEFRAALERHQFLTQQTGDLEQASAKLKQVIAELDQLMDQEFRRTFQAVAKAFTGYFTRLFGGGTAKLMLTNPDDIVHTGVDVIARPPGKRPTSLSMLSGGERALTAAALIFALLSVSPTPFCFLDEVDAALDEANVGRFREVLDELSENTQFILITHNRGTIEVANTIYGISMGADSVSQSLSLKLDSGKLEPA